MYHIWSLSCADRLKLNAMKAMRREKNFVDFIVEKLSDDEKLSIADTTLLDIFNQGLCLGVKRSG
jgi:hypothetical protein